MENIYDLIFEKKQQGQDLVLVTVTEQQGMGPSDLGKKMLVDEEGHSFGTIGGGYIEHYAIKKCKSVIQSRKSVTEKYVLNGDELVIGEDKVILPMACGGSCTLFYEFIGPKQRVYIFGGGHCGKALSKTLKDVGFYVTVIDYRQEILDAIEPNIDEKVCLDFADYLRSGKVKKNSYIVVATPSHKSDFEVLNSILELDLNPAYFGMLCSQKKIVDYISQLSPTLKEKSLKNLYSPIGLDIGGSSPEEISLSIASEILAVYYEKTEKNCHLREKIDPKHRYF